MSPSQVLQPLVCCLGDPVAGNPTQFVMSRASRDLQLDWRFFTSHVLKDDFETALRGIKALGPQGFAILDPYQDQVLPFLDTVTESGLALGRVSVGRSDGASWLGDNLFGQAIVQTLERHLGDLQATGGETVLRSRVVVVGTTGLANCLTLHTRNLAVEIFHLDNAPNTERNNLLDDTDTVVNVALVVEGRLAKGLHKQLTNLKWPNSAYYLQADITSAADGKADREAAKGLGIQLIDHVELLAQEACCNFQFWTGVMPSFEMMRESLEEYLAC